MNGAKITEIFSSLQGEGPYAGVPQVFLRFFDCNLGCAWCDTPGSRPGDDGPYQVLSVDEVFTQVRALWDCCHSLSLTGGEPLLQAAFIRELLPRLREAGMPAYLETNGVLVRELEKVLPGMDYIAMDFKLPSSTGAPAFWNEHEAFLRAALEKGPARVFIKTVISAATDPADVARAADLVARVNRDLLLILQPNSQDWDKGILAQCAVLQKACLTQIPNVRVLPQWHRLMNLR